MVLQNAKNSEMSMSEKFEALNKEHDELLVALAEKYDKLSQYKKRLKTMGIKNKYNHLIWWFIFSSLLGETVSDDDDQ